MAFRMITAYPAVLVFTGGLMAAGCGGGDSPTQPTPTPTPEPPAPPPAPTVSVVEVSPTEATLEVGRTQRFTATARASNGTVISGVDFAWSSSNTAVVTINDNGVATAVGAGMAMVRATADGIASAPVTINVAEPPPPEPVAATVTVSPPEATIEEGATQQFEAKAATSDGTDIPDAEFMWSSSDEKVATVDSDGLATGVGVGNAMITATVDSVSGMAMLTVTQPPPEEPVSPFPDSDPEWLRNLSSDYPYPYRTDNVRVFSDISPTFSKSHSEHLKLVWDFFDNLYAENRGSHLDIYYTSDPEVFRKVIPHCPTIFIPDARVVTACYLDYPRWFVIPYQIPDFGSQLHEIGHDFLFATWPGSENFPWFKEGTAMYFEGGAFSDDNSFSVPTPYSWCTELFDRHDSEGNLISLEQLLHLEKDLFLEDAFRTYPQACMLIDYLERRESGVLYTLIDRINAGQILTNDQLVMSLLDLTGKSVTELENAYLTYARE